MGLDDLTQRVIVGAASPAELLAWQTTEEGQALLDEPRTAGAFEQALERAVREARGPARRAVCETLLTQGFEHIIGRVLSRCSRDELRMFEPELRRRILGVETEADLEDLLRRALGPASPGTRKPGPLVGAALLRIAAEDDPVRMERLVEILRAAPTAPVAESLYRAFPTSLAFEARLAAGIAITHFDGRELREEAERQGLLAEDSLHAQLQSADAGLRERALLLAMLHGGHRLTSPAVEAGRGLDPKLLADCAFACRRASPQRNYVAAAVFFAFVEAPQLTRLIATFSERSFRETNPVALWAAAERCRCPEVDGALRKEAEAGQEDAMYALAHGRAAAFVDDLIRWAGGVGKGAVRPTALRLLAESKSEAGICHLVQVILQAEPGPSRVASIALRDHGLIGPDLDETLSRDSSRRIRGRGASSDFAVSETSGLGLVSLLVAHGGRCAEPLLSRFASHPAPSVATAARDALARLTRPTRGDPYR